MNIVLFTANYTGGLLLERLKRMGLRPHVVTYSKGFQRTGLAEDLSRFSGDFPMTLISDNSALRCAVVENLIKGCVPVCVDWTKDFFNGTDYPVICSHPALLPKYRGYSAVTEQFERGVALSGATFYIKNEKIDGGDIIYQKRIKLPFDGYPADFLAEYADACAEFIAKLSTSDLSSFTPRAQDDTSSFYLQRKRTRDALIDFGCDAFSLYNHIRAYSRPYFGAYFMTNGRKVTVWRAVAEKWQGDYGEPGTIIEMSANGTEVACGSGTIVITETEGMIWDDVEAGQIL